ncbi:MAG: ABC transporter ATP-binding protein, partial [Chloroflexi bacterium]|nr:ABC transporter ATP-binding protein [Chloroflexota bacterium]
MEEAAHLCDRIVVLHQGRIQAEGTPAELVERFAGREVIEVHLPPEERAPVLERLAARDGVTVEEVEDILYVYVRAAGGFDRTALRIDADKVVYRRANLEDVFLRLTGRGLVE